MFQTLKLKKNSNLMGIVAGIGAAFNFAFYPALIALLINANQNGLTHGKTIALGFAVVAAKETFTFFVSVLLSPKIYFSKSFWQQFKTKWGWLSVLAGILGGPIGYSLITVASIFIGAATPDAINLGLLLVMTTLLERFLLKRKVNFIFIIGVMIVLFSCIGLITAQGSTIHNKIKFMIGFGFAFFAALSWAIENIIADYIFTKNDIGMTPKDFLGIKLLSSASFAVPITIMISYIGVGNSYGFDKFTEFYSDWEKVGLMTAVGILIFLGRMCYFTCIKLSTSKVASSLLVLQLIFAPIFIIIIYAITKKGSPHDLAVVKTWWFWVTSITIIIGVGITSLNPDKIMSFFRIKEKVNQESCLAELCQIQLCKNNFHQREDI